MVVVTVELGAGAGAGAHSTSELEAIDSVSTSGAADGAETNIVLS